jgi:hypothetical protein
VLNRLCVAACNFGLISTTLVVVRNSESGVLTVLSKLHHSSWNSNSPSLNKINVLWSEKRKDFDPAITCKQYWQTLYILHMFFFFLDQENRFSIYIINKNEKKGTRNGSYYLDLDRS